jgi:hypothetical protein
LQHAGALEQEFLVCMLDEVMHGLADVAAATTDGEREEERGGAEGGGVEGGGGEGVDECMSQGRFVGNNGNVVQVVQGLLARAGAWEPFGLWCMT